MATVKVLKSIVWDVIVIAGGPAGMMAAIEAGARGASVLLLEKNHGLGKKLLITGGGRCNVTNNQPVVRDLVRHYRDAGQFLFSTFMQYGVTDTIKFFAEHGLPFIEENEGRMFPITQKAESVFAVLEQSLTQHAVQVSTKEPVRSIVKNGELFHVTGATGKVYEARSVVVATGGSARPETGSTGDGWHWLHQLGHTIHSVSTALVPVSVREPWALGLGGVSLPQASIAIYVLGKKRHKAVGKLLFTHVGLSGPLILNQSALIGEWLVEGEVVIKIDLAPEIDAGVVQAELLEQCLATPNKKIKNILREMMPAPVVDPFLLSLQIDGETKAHSLLAPTRKRIGVAMKAWPLTISGLLGADKAVATAGGVDLTEVDFRTMESRLVPGLFMVGDVLNINRPSGGYSLQLCWTTGAVAGRSCPGAQR